MPQWLSARCSSSPSPLVLRNNSPANALPLPCPSILLPYVPLHTLHPQIFGRYLRLVAQKAQVQLGDANSVAQEALGAMSTVRAFAGESEELERYHQQLLVYYNTNLKRCFAYR